MKMVKCTQTTKSGKKCTRKVSVIQGPGCKYCEQHYQLDQLSLKNDDDNNSQQAKRTAKKYLTQEDAQEKFLRLFELIMSSEKMSSSLTREIETDVKTSVECGANVNIDLLLKGKMIERRFAVNHDTRKIKTTPLKIAFVLGDAELFNILLDNGKATVDDNLLSFLFFQFGHFFITRHLSSNIGTDSRSELITMIQSALSVFDSSSCPIGPYFLYDLIERLFYNKKDKFRKLPEHPQFVKAIELLVAREDVYILGKHQELFLRSPTFSGNFDICYKIFSQVFFHEEDFAQHFPITIDSIKLMSEEMLFSLHLKKIEPRYYFIGEAEKATEKKKEKKNEKKKSSSLVAVPVTKEYIDEKLSEARPKKEKERRRKEEKDHKELELEAFNDQLLLKFSQRKEIINNFFGKDIGSIIIHF